MTSATQVTSSNAVQNVLHGQFERTSAQGVAITVFTLTEVSAGEIRFVHAGGNNVPAFDVAASDGAHTTAFVPASIAFVPPVPSASPPANEGVLNNSLPPPPPRNNSGTSSSSSSTPSQATSTGPSRTSNAGNSGARRRAGDRSGIRHKRRNRQHHIESGSCAQIRAIRRRGITSIRCLFLQRKKKRRTRTQKSYPRKRRCLNRTGISPRWNLTKRRSIACSKKSKAARASWCYQYFG